MKIHSNAIYIQRIYALLICFIALNSFLNGFVSSTIIRTLECVIFGFIVYYYIKCRISMRSTGKYANTMMALLMFWCLFIVWRGNWNVGIKQMVFNIIDSRGLSLYLLPLLFFLPYNIISIKKILNVFFIGAILSFPLWFLNSKYLIQVNSFHGESIAVYLPFLSAFLMMITPSLSRTKILIIVVVYAVYFLLMLLNARRNVSFSFFCYGLMAYYIYLRFVNHRRALSNIIMVLFSLLLALLVLNSIDSLSHGTFSYMGKRIGQDSRSGVEALFISDFNKSPVSEWICGRGMSGTYYQEILNIETGMLQTGRIGIETGYLDMILKGGIVYVLLILMILIPAIYKGLKSGKMFGVSCGLFLSLYIVDMYTTCPISIFSIRAILFWSCISICYRKERYIDIGTLRKLVHI
jgi:hypothetical protein